MQGSMVEQIIAILTRAQQGVRACTRLASATASAFADEYENIEEVKRGLLGLIGQDA